MYTRYLLNLTLGEPEGRLCISDQSFTQSGINKYSDAISVFRSEEEDCVRMGYYFSE